MKKPSIPNILRSMLIILLFVAMESCCEKCVKCETPTEDKINCETLSTINTIPIDTAYKYIGNFWNNGECLNMSRTNGMACYFDRGEFENLFLNDSATYKGYTFFPCISETTDGSGYFYIGFKPETICPGGSKPYQAIRPRDRFYSAFVPNNTSIRRNYHTTYRIFLQGLIRGQDPIENSDAKTIARDNFNFRECFADYDNYSEFGYGFIHEDYFKRFIRQSETLPGNPISGFWIVLGYNEKNTYEKIRMVFMPANADGSVNLNAQSMCLEKSWPPINPN